MRQPAPTQPSWGGPPLAAADWMGEGSSTAAAAVAAAAECAAANVAEFAAETAEEEEPTTEMADETCTATASVAMIISRIK